MFIALVTLGLVVGFVLGVRQAVIDPVLDVGDPRVRVEGRMATVQVTVRNTSGDTAYCPIVGIAALDREGLDLDSGIALPDLSDGRLGPGESANYIGTLTQISAQEFNEELDEYVGFIEEENECP
ncbi:hypothetical protein [Candidatus Poriferisocius sp.]|uniref:hypothetical protein n=1 Tax=Candidatus Poriferisocius sp. TaxID=3101276 RepID=UPI003B59A6FE